MTRFNTMPCSAGQRSGLLGPADITEDGYIEYSEIQAFVRAANHRVSDPKAKLDIYVHAPVQDRNRPLLDLLTLRDSVLLDMPKTASGRYYLEDHRGIRLADFNKSEEQPLTLALLSSKTNYLREKEGGVEYEIHPAEQQRIRFSELTPRPYEMAPRGSVERSFRAHLFTLPFGRGFYAGVVDGLEIVPARKVARADWSVPEESLSLRIDITDNRLVLLTDWRPKAAWSTLAIGVGTLAGAVVLTYFAVDKICDKLNLPVPPQKKVLNKLKEEGFNAVLTHFKSRGFRTNAPSDIVKEIVAHLVTKNC